MALRFEPSISPPVIARIFRKTQRDGATLSRHPRLLVPILGQCHQHLATADSFGQVNLSGDRHHRRCDVICELRLTVDTDVVVAAMRSPAGASAELLTLLLQDKGTWLLSLAVAIEYESICMLADHRLAAGASEGDVRNLLNSILA